MVEAALDKTGYQMYRDVAVINVPDLVIMKTYKETIVMLLDQMKSIADHECIEEVALSIMLGKQNTIVVPLKKLTFHVARQCISHR